MPFTEYITLARVIHVLAVVLWIGGVAMVTTVLIPSVRKFSTKENQIKTFEQIEGKFAKQAKILTLLTGLTGFYMLFALDSWERYLDYRYWWIHGMTLIWFLFTLILFVLEPLLLHRLFRKYAEQNPERTFRFIQTAHWVLLTLSLITITGAVAGSHGWFMIR
ncbi:MAG: hypothetical protein WC760_08950 [Bacteroidia bacterium]|jgi:uncharacterized membrane protein